MKGGEKFKHTKQGKKKMYVELMGKETVKPTVLILLLFHEIGPFVHSTTKLRPPRLLSIYKQSSDNLCLTSVSHHNISTVLRNPQPKTLFHHHSWV